MNKLIRQLDRDIAQSLASLIILLMWLYFCGNLLVIGAVMGQVWARGQWRRDPT